MGRAFRYIGPGVLKDIVEGKVIVHMGRRADAAGHVIEGEIVRNHTIADAKLDAWVKDGRAEYVNVVENVVDKVTGGPASGKPSPEAARESAIHQQTADHTDARMRMQALADLRTVMASAVFDDDDRKIAEMELAEAPTVSLPLVIDATTRERDKRIDAAKPKGKAKEKKAAGDLDLGGAGPGGAK